MSGHDPMTCELCHAEGMDAEFAETTRICEGLRDSWAKSEIERDALAQQVAQFRVWCDRLEAAIRDHRMKIAMRDPVQADAELWAVLDA